MLEINLENAVSELKKINAKKVFVQVPEGLKIKVTEIIENLEKNGFQAITCLEPCYGACDIKPREAKELSCNAILHIGHNEFIQSKELPIIYLPLKYDLGKNFEKIITKLMQTLKESKKNKVGLITTIQYLHYLPKIKKALEEKGIIAKIGKGKRVQDGQILGCNYSSANIKGTNAIIYFGDGLFHPLGVSFSTSKEVIIANPLTLEVSFLKEEKEKFLKKRILAIEKAKNVKEFGILVTTKIGQNKIQEAERIKKELEENGKIAKIFVMDFISSEKLLGIKAEALINTACPRIVFDDYLNYKQVMLNKNEVDYLLGKKKYEEYKIEEVY